MAQVTWTQGAYPPGTTQADVDDWHGRDDAAAAERDAREAGICPCCAARLEACRTNAGLEYRCPACDWMDVDEAAALAGNASVDDFVMMPKGGRLNHRLSIWRVGEKIVVTVAGVLGASLAVALDAGEARRVARELEHVAREAERRAKGGA